MENNRLTKKTRFNIVDAIVIVAVLTFIALFVFVLDPFAWFKDDAYYKETQMTYVVEIKGVDSEIIDSISENNDIFDSVNGDPLGTVESIEVLPHYEWKSIEGESEMKQVEVQGKKDMKITVRVSCTYQKDIGYIVGSQQIAVGSKMNICCSEFFGSGYCITIKE